MGGLRLDLVCYAPGRRKNIHMTTLIQDLIDLPEKVHSGDFVLKLTEGVSKPEATLAPYVVTPQLATCFDAALDFIKDAVHSNSSKAAYLHGSFGSGKSHFMAVLHLLLQRNATARAKEGLAPVVTKHNSWLEDKKFLLVPYHMIGQRTMETAILGGYVKQVLSLHPEAPVPAVYRAEGLFRDAVELRKTLGDPAFFERLNRDTSGDAPSSGDGWGELEASWDAPRFEAALAAVPGNDERSELIGVLVQQFFQSYKDVARGDEGAFVSLDEGLAVISRHAAALGYDALVLFLDELILWLATHSTNQAFLNEEGPKVSKLVEAESADRPIPIASFVARQRDLRELVGDHVTGAEQLGFADVLRWWEARFDTITLEDRNLPEIAARRVLRPKSEAARQEIDQAWRATEKIREEVFRVLLTKKAKRNDFRLIYPFSPALMETLVAVSSALQRERTALKVMLMLLVSQRETLELGQIVPVGDLWDVISQGDEPFTEAMRLHFENAKRLYFRKLLPMLESNHQVSEEEVAKLPAADAKARAFRADARLLKTLLLAALVPEVEVLKDLTAARLTALNHGTFRAPLPGREAQQVLSRCRDWTANGIGEIKIGDHVTDPTISIQLTGVDTEGILANAQSVDNHGNRRRKIRELLFQQLSIEDRDEMFLTHEILWRGTRRTFQVIFGNVRELTTETLATKGGQRKLVLDFPFDETGRTPADDVARLDTFRAEEKPSRTLVWLPAFLSAAAQRDLARLVKLDDILKSNESFAGYASHLSVIDQVQARQLLHNQRDQLRQRLIIFLEGSYGVRSPEPGSIDDSYRAEPFQSLDPSLTPAAPVGSNLRQTLEELLGQILASQYPAHPVFGLDEVKTPVLKKIQGELARAVQNERIDVAQPLRPLMHKVTVPLKLGEMGDTHFVLGRHWYTHFNKLVEGEGEMTVGKLRRAMSEPLPTGLPTTVENLVILVYADQTNRSFVLHGGPVQPRLENLPDELELREVHLPAPEAWEEASLRVSKLFGLTTSPLRNATNVSELSGKLSALAAGELSLSPGVQYPSREECQELKDRLEGVYADFKITADARLETARAVLALVSGLAAASSDRTTSSAPAELLVESLASAAVTTSLAAMGTSYSKVRETTATLKHTRWALFEAVAALSDDRRTAAEGLRSELEEALRADEYVTSLDPRLGKLEGDAIRLLTPTVTSPPPLPPLPGVEIVSSSIRKGMTSAKAKEVLAGLIEKVSEDESFQLDLNWTIYREPK
jgi:hypothetical protein